LKVAFEVQDVEREIEFFGDAACIVNVVERAATRRQRVAVFVDIDPATLIPELHRETDKLVSLFLENCRGRGRIHATTHCYCYLHLIANRVYAPKSAAKFERVRPEC